MKQSVKPLFVGLSAMTVLMGCQSEGTTGQDADVNVVASFLPMYEFTKQVAGDRANVQLMVSEGQDAHGYEPSAQDVAAVNEADVFVYSSEEMEFWVDSLFNTLENNDLVIARAADGLEDAHHDHADAGDITVEGVADHYHTGDAVTLTAKVAEDVDYDHWHWYQRADENEEWSAVPGQSTDTFSVTAEDASFDVQAVLYDNDHNVFAESEAVAIEIDNHDDHHHDEEEHDHAPSSDEPIEIIGLADHYHTGDVVTLQAETSKDVTYDDWHWFKKEEHDDDWQAVPEQDSSHFEHKTTGESFDIKAVLYDDDHNVHAESPSVHVLIDDHDDQDPHIWLDPVLAQDQVRMIRDALIEADPDGESTYTKNADQFIHELQALDEDFRTALEGAENRTFVVQHQAFGYLADRYDLEQIAIGGLSTEIEPSPSRMAEIGELIEEYDVPVIYYQQGANSAIAQTVATETGTEIAVLYDLEVLSEELLENDLGYVEAMRQNLEALQQSVQ